MPKLTVKPIIYKKGKTDDQEAAIAIRVTYNGKHRHQECHYRSKIKWFDEESGSISKDHHNHAHANASINKQRYKIERELLIMKEEPGFSITTIEKYLDPFATVKKGSFSFFVIDYCAKQSELYEKSKGRDGIAPGTIKNYEKALNKLHFFSNRTNVLFSDIDVDFLERYKLWMMSDKPVAQGEKRNRGHNANNFTTVWDTLTKFIVKFLNLAKIPVPDFKWPRQQEGTVEYLTLEQVDQLEAVLPKLKGDEYTDCLYFLIECYAGIRHSDWKRFSVEKLIDGDNFKVRAKKNGEPVYLSLANRPRLARIIKLAENIPYTGTLDSTNHNLKIIFARGGVEKRASTHVGRHTCGVLHAELGYSIEFVAELLGITVAAARTYYKTTRRKLFEEEKRIGRGL